MKTFITIACLLIGSANLLAQGTQGTPIDQGAQELFQLFTPEQKKQVVLPFDSPERMSQVFPPGKRPGILLKDLSAEQHKKALALIQSFVSDYGWQKVQEIAKQRKPPGLDEYYITFFGEPAPQANYAWRIAEHHLTIVDVEYADGKIHSIGPILLGANPPTLWNEEEDKIIVLFASIPTEQKAKLVHQGRGMSAEPIKTAGVAISDLGTDVENKAQELVQSRLKFFSPKIVDRINQIIQDQGEIKAMHVAFWGEATKRCADGGHWDFKMGSANFLCDYENTRGHIHMSLSGKAND